VVSRRTTWRKAGGRPLRRNDRRDAPDDFRRWEQAEIRLERSAPGPGDRHLLTLAQLRRFLALLPEWDTVAEGLDAIVLDGRERGAMGWCSPGVIGLCAWERRLWWTHPSPEFLVEHRHVLDALEVEQVKRGPRVEVRWTERQARAFQLLHILPHELGHHHDRITNRGREFARGEPYAEAYADRVLSELLPVYFERFEW
jgi:hypothetical protein